ncbi:MAG: FAD-dependent oxidoreductase [Burkholderiaceae bacterium]|jgi:NADH dehydrogenase FAD-containing subunit|nr:FAD-dependent oxidoreductase [Burkholderiaceae bacterium]
MTTLTASNKHLVLLGAGRANLQVLGGLARQGKGALGVTLVAPHTHYIDRAMVPGYVAGDYTLDDIRKPLEPLAQAAGVRLALGNVHTLDVAARRIQLTSGDALAYDVLSIDCDPVVDRDLLERQTPGARQGALFMWPLENFVHLWPQVRALAQQRALQVAVIGNGRAAAEIALACASVLAAPHGSRVALVTGAAQFLPGEPPVLQRKVLAKFRQTGITLLPDNCVALDGRELHLSSGARLACDAPIMMPPPTRPAWLLHTGMQASDDGHPVVNERLQSESHRQVFIVPTRAPLQLGQVLEANLRTALAGGTFARAPLDTSGLRAMQTGSGCALATWGPLALEGREVWHWKDRRDRRHLAGLFRH